MSALEVLREMLEEAELERRIVKGRWPKEAIPATDENLAAIRQAIGVLLALDWCAENDAEVEFRNVHKHDLHPVCAVHIADWNDRKHPQYWVEGADILQAVQTAQRQDLSQDVMEP